MKRLKRVFGSDESRRVVCFTVENYDEICESDAEVITKLEKHLAAAGAIPAKIDFPSRVCCATITDPDVRPEDIQQVLETLGFRVTRMDSESRKE